MLTLEQRQKAERLFRAAGNDRPLRIARLIGDGESIFVVDENALPKLPYELGAGLQQALRRKVWIVAGPDWPDTEALRLIGSP